MSNQETPSKKRRIGGATFKLPATPAKQSTSQNCGFGGYKSAFATPPSRKPVTSASPFKSPSIPYALNGDFSSLAPIGGTRLFQAETDKPTPVKAARMSTEHLLSTGFVTPKAQKDSARSLLFHGLTPATPSRILPPPSPRSTPFSVDQALSAGFTTSKTQQGREEQPHHASLSRRILPPPTPDSFASLFDSSRSTQPSQGPLKILAIPPEYTSTRTAEYNDGNDETTKGVGFSPEKSHRRKFIRYIHYLLAPDKYLKYCTGTA
jgi:hypothetical protein